MNKADKDALRGELNVLLIQMDMHIDELEKLYGKFVNTRNEIYRIGERRGLYEKEAE